jgi:hypothetical protein
MDIQTEVQKIHHQFGVTEKANYEIQKLFDKAIKEAVTEALRIHDVSGSLFLEWLKQTYPLMYRDEDYAELDYTDLQKFVFWVEEQINSGRFSNCH